jgi:hypothetical protein
MLFLVEIDHVKPGLPLTPEQGQTFIDRIILPTLARAEHLLDEGKIISGGPVAGRVALRFTIEAASLPDLDEIVTSLPIWPMSETRITPLVGWTERRKAVQALSASIK